MLDVVERIVNKETQLGNDAQLIPYSCSQFVPNGLLVCLDIRQQLLSFVAGEDAEIGGADAQVGRDFHSRHITPCIMRV